MGVELQGVRKARKDDRSYMDTLLVTPDTLEGWTVPPFQRPVRVNEKVRTMAEELKQNGGVISGILTLGRVGKGSTVYIIDGQHRIEAFRISSLREFLADVRMCHFDTMAEAADEFVRLNSSLVRMRPDDMLRGMEPSIPSLQKIRKECDFVGYDQIRRGPSNPVVSMSGLLRSWISSQYDTPSTGSMGGIAALADQMDELSAEQLCQFLAVARAAWGRDVENYRLWGNLNLALSMWLWRRLVIDRDRSGSKRYEVISVAQFKQCLMSVSADRDYVDWLQGRRLDDRDRAQGFARLKAIFVKRLRTESGSTKTPQLPQPPWGAR